MTDRIKRPKKENLPTKICATCGRPFAWRKKWEKVWTEVRYCSDRCRGNKPAATT
ncbi:DUF2256 domain-containing protein [Beijerinckia sp. L45]|uniref:DUF2256 domain-containing protein n=1 Tax=Beijerinckia sp. L45 TaxID=1641855 RepID=UPI00131CC6D9|nr:DUF2256 domain-containing protein [Beijerinckia sp. L45]